MGKEAKAKKDRLCGVCGRVFLTTAKGIKEHVASCKGRQS